MIAIAPFANKFVYDGIKMNINPEIVYLLVSKSPKKLKHSADRPF